MVSHTVKVVTAFLLLGLGISANHAVAQQSSVDAILDGLDAVHQFREVTISPDGQRVAWVEAVAGASGVPSPNSAIFVASANAPVAAGSQITAGSRGNSYKERGIAWSPDSRQLAFLSNVDNPDQLQLYIASVDGGVARKLTNLTGALQTPAWSPDGKTLAVLFTENAPRAPGPMEPMTPPSGVIGAKIYEQRLTTVAIASGDVRQVSPANLYIHEYDWSPDGKQFVATTAPGSGDANWYVAEIYTIDAVSGASKSIYKPTVQIAVPRWSPDGKTIAFIGGLMSDEGSIGSEVFVLPASGGAVRNLTPGLKASACWLAWRPRSDEILLLESLDGASGIATVGVATRKVTQLWSGPETLSVGGRHNALSVARDGSQYGIVRESLSQPPEIWTGPAGKWQQITSANHAVRPDWGKAESIHWPSEGLTIQGWLIYPRDYDPSRRYPLAVFVHGGPASIARPVWPGTFFDFAVLSSQGYFVLRPNPRGSLGQGQAFAQANVKDFGYGDLRDIIAGVDYVVKNFPVDNNRVGIGGWSYGGFMTMWAVTQTHRFSAAVSGAGVANWQSYYGENDIDQWLIPYFGASVYDDPAVYAKSSPITFIKNTVTPTLILVGDRDGECPVPQSFEFWHALEALGVENQFVVYPAEGHTIFDPGHRRDIMRRTIEWYDRHLK